MHRYYYIQESYQKRNSIYIVGLLSAKKVANLHFILELQNLACKIHKTWGMQNEVEPNWTYHGEGLTCIFPRWPPHNQKGCIIL